MHPRSSMCRTKSRRFTPRRGLPFPPLDPRARPPPRLLPGSVLRRPLNFPNIRRGSRPGRLRRALRGTSPKIRLHQARQGEEKRSMFACAHHKFRSIAAQACAPRFRRRLSAHSECRFARDSDAAGKGGWRAPPSHAKRFRRRRTFADGVRLKVWALGAKHGAAERAIHNFSGAENL